MYKRQLFNYYMEHTDKLPAEYHYLMDVRHENRERVVCDLSLIHISEPTRPEPISYAVFCLKKFFFNDTATTEIYTLEFVGSVRCV